MQVNMQEAESSLSELGELAWQGEEIIIAKAGKPFLRLTPYYEEAAQRRLSGALRGADLGLRPILTIRPRADRPVL